MNPPIPAPDALPVSWGYIQGLLMLVFPLHLLLMNAMIGCAALSLYALAKGREDDRRLSHELAKALPFLIALAINFGVAALLFLQVLYGQFLYASSVLMAFFWLSVPLVVLAAYYAAYVYDFQFAALGKAALPLAASMLAVFLAVAFLFTNNTTLMLEPSRWTAYFRNPGGTVLNAGSSAMWPRYLHFAVGGLAIGGLFVALFGRFLGKRAPEAGARAVELGTNVFTGLTALQVGIGTWYLVALPRAVMQRFVGGSGAATALLAAGVALTLAALAAGARRRVATSAALAVPLVFVMAFLRDMVRSGYLEPYFNPARLPVTPEYSPLLLFLVALSGGAATIVWMLRKTAGLYRGGI